MNTNNQEILKEDLKEENTSIPNNGASSSVDETGESQSTMGETEGSTEETAEEAEIVEEVEELLESEKEKDMKKNKKKLEEENTKLQSDLDDFKDKYLRTSAEYENFRKRKIGRAHV